MGKMFKKSPTANNTPVFSSDNMRLLFLDGAQGSVACRVHGTITCGTAPRLSEEKRLELATRALLRMKNLSAIRGKPGASMVGPADYYGNLEKPNENFYTIAINQGIPQFYQTSRTVRPIEAKHYHDIAPDKITCVKAHWVSGTNKQEIKQKEKRYHSEQTQTFGESLFPNPGILEIQGDSDLHLKSFDARNINLASFKAELVCNNQPFTITDQPLPAKDEYRAVSFLYEPGYGPRQVSQGGGLFLETHSFAQTITPLDEKAKGHVVLGRWKDDNKEELELVAIKIPFGYTLIIKEESIHGDATLDGMFMMCMTSNHKTMQTADSVFLKSTETRKNINMVFDAENQEEINEDNHAVTEAPRPFALYKESDESAVKQFLHATQGMNFIFNPFSHGYWQRSFALFRESGIGWNILYGTMLVLGIAAVAVAFGAFNAVSLGVPGIAVAAVSAILVLSGIGLFAAEKTLPNENTQALSFS